MALFLISFLKLVLDPSRGFKPVTPERGVIGDATDAIGDAADVAGNFFG